MKIRTIRRFKHGTEQFGAGENIDVPPDLASYFINVGWAVDANDQTTPVVKEPDPPPPAGSDVRPAGWKAPEEDNRTVPNAPPRRQIGGRSETVVQPDSATHHPRSR